LFNIYIAPDGHLEIRFENGIGLNPGASLFLTSNSPINNGIFREIRLELIPSKIIILIDEIIDKVVLLRNEKSIFNGFWPMENILNNNSTLQIGSIENSFAGCVSDFYIGENFIPLGKQPGLKPSGLISAFDIQAKNICDSYSCYSTRDDCALGTHLCENFSECISVRDQLKNKTKTFHLGKLMYVVLIIPYY
jgi:hypothetical protein